MKTLIQKVILFLYGWRIHNVAYKAQDYYTGDYTTGYYSMVYKRKSKLDYEYRYYPVDVAWMKQFGVRASKRVTFAIIFGDLFTFSLVVWFIIWLSYTIATNY